MNAIQLKVSRGGFFSPAYYLLGIQELDVVLIY